MLSCSILSGDFWNKKERSGSFRYADSAGEMRLDDSTGRDRERKRERERIKLELEL